MFSLPEAPFGNATHSLEGSGHRWQGRELNVHLSVKLMEVHSNVAGMSLFGNPFNEM